MSKPGLETERLLLRPLTISDIEDLAAIYSDAEVMRFLPSGVRSQESARADIEWVLSLYEQYDLGVWATIYKPDNRFIGRCGLLPEEIDGVPAWQVVYLLAKPYWGRGLATEAVHTIVDYGFQQSGLSRLIAIIHPDNRASQRVAEKCGMRDAGERCEMRYRVDGQLCDLLCRVYSIENSIRVP